MMIRGHVEARPWKPQDLLDDLQKMIDEEPDAYLNDRRTTLCTARDYLKEYFNTYLPEQKKGHRQWPAASLLSSLPQSLTGSKGWYRKSWRRFQNVQHE